MWVFRANKGILTLRQKCVGGSCTPIFCQSGTSSCLFCCNTPWYSQRTLGKAHSCGPTCRHQGMKFWIDGPARFIPFVLYIHAVWKFVSCVATFAFRTLDPVGCPMLRGTVSATFDCVAKFQTLEVVCTNRAMGKSKQLVISKYGRMEEEKKLESTFRAKCIASYATTCVAWIQPKRSIQRETDKLDKHKYTDFGPRQDMNYSNRCVILCIFCAPYVCNVVRRHVDSLQCVSRKRAWCKLMILRRRACSQTIFCQRRVLSNLVLRFLNSAAGTRLGSASDVRIAVILLCTMATRCFPIHPILFVPGCCKPRQRDAGPAKAVRAKGKTQCACVPFP